jgi:aspartate aminotransferase-like enzyme
MAAFGKFFLPGPTEVRPAIRRVLSQPMIGHRTEEFEQLFVRIQAGLRYVFRTTRPVYVATSSATGLMEAGVRCAPAGPVLALVNGAFSARFAEIALLTGRECDRYEVPPGQVHDPDELRRRFDARRYSVITVVHSETSTGALNDVQALAVVARERGITCVVDSVSGIGGTPFDFDALGVDYALTGSQKALALPPGLAFAAATPAFVAGARNAAARGLYFDLLEFEELVAKNQTPNTPAVSLLFALDTQLDDIRGETLPVRWQRHAEMLRCVEEWVEQMREKHGLELSITAAAGNRSPTVSSIRLPGGVSEAAFISAVADHGYTVGPGYKGLGGNSFRIGHMGDHTPKGVEACLRACEKALLELTGR